VQKRIRRREEVSGEDVLSSPLRNSSPKRGGETMRAWGLVIIAQDKHGALTLNLKKGVDYKIVEEVKA